MSRQRRTRISKAVFAAEADRRGYVKLTAGNVIVGRKRITEIEQQMRRECERLVANPGAAASLWTVQIMRECAGWLATYRELHDDELKRLGIEVPS